MTRSDRQRKIRLSLARADPKGSAGFVLTTAPFPALVNGVKPKPNPARFEKTFVGSKGANGVFHTIINEIPPHRVLIEPFAGEATIARKIRPPEEIILVDKVRQPGLWFAADVAKRVNFIQGDGIAFLDSYRWSGREFVYADPPYLLQARAQRGRHYYPAEMSEADHRRFLRIVKSINARVMVSGYHSPLYDDALTDWRAIEFQTMTRGGTLATECLWMNYPAPTVLHDWSFVGADFRARCRLRRKMRRAVADLVSMPPLERGAMFDALSRAMRRDQGSAPEVAPTAAENFPRAHRAESGAGGLRAPAVRA